LLCWRIIQQPESLVAQVLRDKYFPNSTFLQASLGRNPSYAWRSIFKAKAIIEKGMLWRVGNGETIKIWGDKWLPSSGSSLVQSFPMGMNLDTRVSFLIDQQVGGWNYSLVQNLFDEGEAEQILSIALSPLHGPDRIIWGGTKNGIFIVCSAYHLEVQRRRQEDGCVHLNEQFQNSGSGCGVCKPRA